MWVNGDLKSTTNGERVGCFIATGNIDISAGAFKKNGNGSLMAYADSTPVPPGTTATPARDVVSVTAWQRQAGRMGLRRATRAAAGAQQRGERKLG